MSKAVVIDSSIWIEIFGNLKKTSICQTEIRKYRTILVPTIVVYELQKKLTQMLGAEEALGAISFLSKYEMCPLTREIAIDAAELSATYKLSSADALVLAHANQRKAVLLTMESEFAKIPNTVVIR